MIEQAKPEQSGYLCPACGREMLSATERCSGSFLDIDHPANVAPVVVAARQPRPDDHDIELVSGKYLNLLNPDPAVITVDVIAHGLSNTGRYAGQTTSFYSVAEHACLVAAKLGVEGYPLSYQLAGLHHDDAEAFIADIARPLKSLLQPAYGQISDRLDAVIADALNIPLPAPGSAMAEAVKAADDWALAAEAHHLMPSKGRGWWCEGLYDPEDHRLAPQGESPGYSYQTFVGFHNGIVNQGLRVASDQPSGGVVVAFGENEAGGERGD